jgi:hypothetical protein
MGPRSKKRQLLLSVLLTCLFGLGVLVVHSGVRPGSGTPSAYSIYQIVLTTDDLPGGGGTFGGLRPPSVNANGAVAFTDNLGLAIYTTADSGSIGPVARAVGQGDSAPGALGTFGSVDGPSLNDDGSFAFRGFGPSPADRGIYFRRPTGDITRLADSSTSWPGTAETFTPSGPASPVASDGGHTIFSHSTDTRDGVFRAVFQSPWVVSSLFELVDLADFVGKPGYASPMDYAVNDSGAAAMVLTEGTVRGVYVASPGGSFDVVVKAGGPAPGGGSFTANLGSPSINASGDIAFMGGFDSAMGVFVAGDAPEITKMADTADEVPNHPDGTFDAFFDVHIGADGSVVFRGRYLLDGVQYQGIYRASGGSLEVIFDHTS